VTTEPAGFLEGGQLRLRDVQLSDVTDDCYVWMNDPEVTRYLETRVVPRSKERIAAYVAEMAASNDSVFLAMIEKAKDRHIGNIKLGPINWIHRRADIALVIGDKRAWCKGYAAEAIGLVSEYAFQTLGLHKVTAGIDSNNSGSTAAFLQAGFVEEGRRRQQYFCNGAWVDQVLLGRVRPATL